MPLESIYRPAYDKAGMTASLACAVHCALLPVLLAVLPALGLAWLASHYFGWTMIGISSLLALRALLPGRGKHRRLLPLLMAAAGLLSVSAGHLFLEASPWSHAALATAGGSAIALAHFLNLRLCQHCEACAQL